jgi:selenocysteine lyase/cysteine desulfurase
VLRIYAEAPSTDELGAGLRALQETDSVDEFEFHRKSGTTAFAHTRFSETTAIDTIEEICLDTVQSRVERLTDRLKDGLGDRLLSPRPYESGLVTFTAENPDDLVSRLRDSGIVIRSLPDPHAVRASVHVFNTADDIDRLLAAL